MTERELLEQLRVTPEAQKLLQAIRYAEGTSGPSGYQTMFGGGKFSDMSKHPDTVVSRGGYKSAAAGAYQFMPGTWQSYASRLGLKTFSPEEQDIAALALARDKLKDIGGISALRKEGLSPRIAAALAPAWASFPTLAGKSYYGQPSKSLESLQKVYGQAPTVASAAVAESPEAQTAVSTTPISIPRFDFQGALRNIITDYALQAVRPSVVDDKSNEYLQLASQLEDEGNTELAQEYRNQAIAATPNTSTSFDPTQLLTSILQKKLQQKVYDAEAQALENRLNNTVSSSSVQPTTASAGSAQSIPLKGVQITSPLDTSGEPGFDFAVKGGRGASFNLPFKAEILKVVKDPWETHLEKGPGRRGYGNFVDVRGTDPATGKQFDVRLAHFDQLNPNLKPGVVIDPGTFIGTQGRTGSTTGPHVSADFYDPNKNTTSAATFDLMKRFRDRLQAGLPPL